MKEVIKTIIISVLVIFLVLYLSFCSLVGWALFS